MSEKEKSVFLKDLEPLDDANFPDVDEGGYDDYQRNNRNRIRVR